MWQLLGGIAIAVAIAAGGYKAGKAVATVDAALERAAEGERVIVHLQKVKVIEEKVVTKYKDREIYIYVNGEEVKNEIETVVAADCVLPPDFMRELRAVSRNTTAAAAGIAEDPSERAGCRATLEVLRQSYVNHYADAAQLSAILERERQLDAVP
ncbi:MAG TPA: hypothetical protein DEH78_14780 [Solibacterales bacterium]|nr:hypothetical protein [Bryobacterales bacterium]